VTDESQESWQVQYRRWDRDTGTDFINLNLSWDGGSLDETVRNLESMFLALRLPLEVRMVTTGSGSGLQSEKQ